MKRNLFWLFIAITILASFIVYAEAAKENSEVQYPDPKRWAEEVDAFLRWDRKNAFPKDAVLFYGSSSIRLWNTAESFPDLPVMNRGIGGSYTADALYYVNEFVIKYKPKVVVIYEGDNDITGSIPPDMVHQDFVRLADAIHAALPDTQIICLATKICFNRWAMRTQVGELNALNHAYCKQKDYLTYVDIASVLLDADQEPKDEYFMDDKLHLNDTGYIQWTNLLAPIIKERYAIAMKK